MEAIGNDPALVQLAEDLGELPRNRQVGFQGNLKLKKVIAIPVFVDDGGKEYVMDLAQAADGEPDLAAREWVTVRGSEAGGRELVRPGGAGSLGVLDVFKAAKGGAGSTLGELALSFLGRLISK